MSRREEAHMTNLPKIKMLRSRFRDGKSFKTTLNAGDLIPLGKAFEVLPGDTIKFTTSSLVRMMTLIAPIMSELYFDTFFFFVPFRLVWEHFPNFLGENDKTPWVSSETYTIPQIQAPEGGWEVGTLADYFEVVPGVSGLEFSALVFRSYAKIVKDWFYDENMQTPPDLLIDDATIVGSNGSDYVVDLVKGGKPFVAGKFHDLFTSCLPAPQKGRSVEIDIADGSGVVYASDESSTWSDYSSTYGTTPMKFFRYDDNGNLDNRDGTWKSNLALQKQGEAPLFIPSGQTSLGEKDTFANVVPSNLRADFISNNPISINDLRLAFATQRLLERMARGGTRYFEILASQWGVIAPQGLIQRSEYLGGSRSRINISSVVQTSATDDISPQGNLSAYSVTTNKHTDFIKSFSEPGYIISLGCIRYKHSYSQGVPKDYMRKDKFDFFNQAFAFIGEQPIKNYQIFAQGNEQDDEIFGYNEAWIEYRVHTDAITGMLRPTYAQPLDFWHLGDKYDTLPTLSADFIKEDKNIVDRVLAVSSENTHQFLLDFYFDYDLIRPMPLYSIPGLLDHF